MAQGRQGSILGDEWTLRSSIGVLLYTWRKSWIDKFAVQYGVKHNWFTGQGDWSDLKQQFREFYCALADEILNTIHEKESQFEAGGTYEQSLEMQRLLGFYIDLMKRRMRSTVKMGEVGKQLKDLVSSLEKVVEIQRRLKRDGMREFEGLTESEKAARIATHCQTWDPSNIEALARSLISLLPQRQLSAQ